MELLKSLYRINSKSGNEGEMKKFFLEQLAGLELLVEEDTFGNIFITKGVANSYPCVTAHFDEVHIPTERNIVVDGDMIYAVDADGERVGIGADDKNGLWIINNLLHTKPVLKVALFVQEERDGDMAGCRGSKACSLSFFNDVRYVLAVDRKGNNEVVTVGKGDIRLCDNDFFPRDVLLKYGYECVPGGRTDVVALKERGLHVPCCNISCGYYNAHKPDEYTVFAHLVTSLTFVSDVIDRI
jgi:putative aminopeptidase FrvX